MRRFATVLPVLIDINTGGRRATPAGACSTGLVWSTTRAPVSVLTGTFSGVRGTGDV
jgi:hypothetical protein